MVEFNQTHQRLEKIFTVVETAAALGRHPISIYKATRGMLKMPIPRFIRMGKSIRFRECDVLFFLNSQTVDPTPFADAVVVEKKKRGRPTKAVTVATVAKTKKVGGAS